MGSSGGFFVDPEALSDARAGVGRLLRDMGEVGEIGADHDPAVFGHAELAESAKEFRERWQGGVRELVGEVASIHRRLGDTVEGYRRVDLEVAAEFRRVSDEGG